MTHAMRDFTTYDDSIEMTKIAVDRTAALVVCLAAGPLCYTKASTPQAPQRASAPPDVVIVRDDVQSVFKNVGTRGTFALLDVSSRRLIVVEVDAAKRISVGRELLAQLGVLSTPSTADSVVRRP